VASFEIRRLEFGDRLRRLREQAGLTGSELASALGWQQPKVSKIERGHQTASDTDVLDWLEAVEAPGATIAEMRQELRDLRVEQIAWRRQLREGHRTRQEQSVRTAYNAKVIIGVDMMAVPGLLQTPDYARSVFASQISLLDMADDVEAAVTARMQRQQVLYDPTKRIEVLIAEAALVHPVCPRPVLAGQIDRLISIIGLSTVRFGVLPAHRQLPHLLPHGFWIMDDVVLVETVTEELRITDPDQVTTFRRLAARLWTAAVEGDEARALLARAAVDLVSG
jgi:transcriptional regulator with XRE-family HTH domain